MDELKKVDEPINVISAQEILGNKFNIYGDFDNPLFLAKDIANWIDNKQVSQMVELVDEDEKLMCSLYMSGQNREVWMLTENGLYEVLMQSRKPIAKEFKKGVKKILHELRTTGNVNINKFDIPQTFADALQLAANQAKQIEVQTKQIEVMQPKAEFFDQVTDSKDALDMAMCAKTLNLGIGRNRLFDFLRSRAILDRNNIPFQRYIDCGYFRTIEQKYTKPDGSTCINIKTVVYQSGMDYIRKLLTKSK